MKRSDGGSAPTPRRKAPRRQPESAGADPRGVFQSKPTPVVHAPRTPTQKAAGKAVVKRAAAAPPKPVPLSPQKQAILDAFAHIGRKPADHPAGGARLGLSLHDDGHYYKHVVRHFLPDLEVPVTGDGKLDVEYLKSPKGQVVQNAANPVSAAGIKVLDQTLRPIHGIATTTDELVKGRSLGDAASAGVHAVKTNKGATFSKVFADLGVGGKVGAALGLVADVAFDPTTYVTFGTGGAVRSIAEKEARMATEQALKAGADELTAVRAGRKAAGAVLAKGENKPLPRGVSVGVRAHVPFTDHGIHPKSSGKASAAVGRAVQPAAAKVRESAVVQGVGKSLGHDFRPKHMTPAQHKVVRDALRAQRAEVSTARKTAHREHAALDAAIGKDGAKVIDAIEGKTKRKVPLPMRDPINVVGNVGDAERTLRLAREEVKSAAHGLGVAKGRAQVLSRNVGGGGKGGAHGVTLAETRLAEAKAFVTEATNDLARVTAERDAHLAQAPERSLQDVAPRPLSDLGDLAPAARRVREMGAQAFDIKKRAGLITEKFTPADAADAQRYVPRKRAIDLEAGAKSSKGTGKTRVTPETGRKIHEPQGVVAGRLPGRDPEKTDPALFSNDIARIAADAKLGAKEKGALSTLWQKVASTGRKFDDRAVMDLQHERVYEVTPHGLAPVLKPGTGGASDHAELAKILDGSRKGKFVILDPRVVNDVEKRLNNLASDEPALRAYDRVQGAVKWGFTQPNPSFHIRNLIGDSVNAFAGDASAHSFAQAARILGVKVGRNGAERDLAKSAPAKLDEPLDLQKSGTVILGEELARAEKEGAISQGFTRELGDLTQREGRFTRASQYREDLPRLATYLSARKRGMTPGAAAEWANKHHFDYGDLTNFERQFARRAIPFWTFFSRNTRMQATKVFTRPGKPATLAKVFNTAAQTAGFNTYDDYVGELKDYKQRGLPIPLKWDGHVYDIQVGLPTTDLNQVTYDARDQLQSLANRITFYKSIGELAFNYSLFFQGQIQDPKAPRTPAPPEVAALPDFLKKKLGVEKIMVEGKPVWGWYKNTDYAIRSLPEGNFVLGQLLPGRGTRSQTGAQARIAFLTGAKVTPHSNDRTELTNSYSRLSDLAAKAGEMKQAGKDRDKDGYYTPAYAKILDEQKKIRDRQAAIKKGLGLPGVTRGKRRPLTPAEQVQADLKELRTTVSADPADQALKDLHELRTAK